MDYLPFNTAGLNADAVDRFYNTYIELKQKFRIEPTGDIDFHLEEMEVFKTCKNINIRGSFAIKNAANDCYILFTEVEYIMPPASRVHSDTQHTAHQTWALAYLKHDFGRVLIRPETLADKIIELVHPVELDFKEDKAFSDTFYVLVNDHDKAIAAIDRNFRNAVMDIRHDEFTIEIFDHTLVIGDRKLIQPESAIHLAEFVARLCLMC